MSFKLADVLRQNTKTKKRTAIIPNSNGDRRGCCVHVKTAILRAIARSTPTCAESEHGCPIHQTQKDIPVEDSLFVTGAGLMTSGARLTPKRMPSTTTPLYLFAAALASLCPELHEPHISTPAVTAVPQPTGTNSNDFTPPPNSISSPSHTRCRNTTSALPVDLPVLSK